MKKAVMFGAGKIGRGFIGQKMADSGYGLTFLDAVPALVEALNAAGQYHVFIVSNDGETVQEVRGFDALLGDDPRAAQRIAECDLMCTAVGVPNLEGAARPIARGIELRSASGGGPLNIIMAENQLGVEEIMRRHLNANLSADDREWADANLGIVAASIQRMVPQPDAEHRSRDPLGVVCEDFSELPVDGDAVVGTMPPLNGLILSTPFSYQEKRKLFLHNMAHALTAYLAYRRGHEWIWQAIEDNEIRAIVRSALDAVSDALSAEYGVSREELEAYADSLLMRFSNRRLGDTVGRVGADPCRKLRADDRLVGAALYVLDHGGDPAPIVRGIAAAFSFAPPDDPSASLLQSELKEHGALEVIRSRLGLEPDGPLAQQILAQLQTDR